MIVSTKQHPLERFGSHIAHAIAGEATTTRIGHQETDVSVYNTVTRSSYGCYRRAELLETHVRIARNSKWQLEISMVGTVEGCDVIAYSYCK